MKVSVRSPLGVSVASWMLPKAVKEAEPTLPSRSTDFALAGSVITARLLSDPARVKGTLW